MRRLLNTVYVTNENMYLTLDGENLVCKLEGETKLRIPFDNIENIVCFNYIGCSPALMGKCVKKLIPINFISPQGRLLAKVCGETQGNVFLRVQQIDKFREHGLELTTNTLAAKFSNTSQVIKRTLHDNAELRDDADIRKTLDVLFPA
ncbi:MAG: CRISPR-associated endonuclease Cas1 [Anaerovoracaceae bacterium]